MCVRACMDKELGVGMDVRVCACMDKELGVGMDGG